MIGKLGSIIGTSVCGLFAIVLIAATPVVVKFNEPITNALCGVASAKQSTESQENLAKSDELCQRIEGDSIVLLKNKDKTLPLKVEEGQTTPINVFGYGATDDGFLLKGVGSGSSAIADNKRVTLLQGLENAGFEVNTDILDEYKDLKDARPAQAKAGNLYNLAEPDVKRFKNTGLLDAAKDFSDTALFVISRDGGENCGEMPTKQGSDSERTYLDISKAEEETLDMLKENFEKVIVILNTTNTMHTGFLEDDEISAAISVGLTGQSGANAIGKVLSGEINPSAKTTDIMTFNHTYDTTFLNHEVKSGMITYAEDIYYGYKWYETADTEHFFDGKTTEYGNGYDGFVQYPFGHGLSYSSFSWTLDSVSKQSNSSLSKDDTITVKVKVENTSDVAGKDIVQLYYSAPYISGGIEKSSINLLDFAKTATLQPGASQIVEMSFTPYNLASYDCYDKNKNGSSTYELDRGDYQIKLMENCHTLKDMDSNTLTYKVDSDIIYDKDPITNEDVKNRFTGKDAYLGMSLDGQDNPDVSSKNSEVRPTYLTRNNFKESYAQLKTYATSHGSNINGVATTLYNNPYNNVSMPETGQSGNLLLATKEDGGKASKSELETEQGSLKINDDLLTELKDYDNEKWDTLLNQMTNSEIKELVEEGGFKNKAVESIGKPKLYDNDGPAGFNNAAQTGQWSGDKEAKWTAYPSEASMGCSWNKKLMLELGLSMGAEGNDTAINGWYAPGVNLHRSAYTARNFEYYSEDGVLSGKLAANVIQGAKINGLKCYLKHFVCSEEGPNPNQVNTWLTEQNLRENYLKPFEIAVKEGGANAIMSAFNRVGASWAGANYALLNDVLRKEWGFRGVVISDWTQGAPVGGMNVRQGVRAGNDLMLFPGTGITDALQIRDKSDNKDTSDRIDLYCARQSAKNIIYSWVDTYTYNRDFDSSKLDDLTKTDISFKDVNKVFPWWIPVYVVLGVSAVGLTAMFSVFLILNIKKGKKDKEVENA